MMTENDYMGGFYAVINVLSQQKVTEERKTLVVSLYCVVLIGH